MSPRKLSEDDRQEILDLYRTTEETTSTLAVRFGVSSSTISRFLKNSLSNLEYENLIQEKRLARTTKSNLEKENQEVLILLSENPEEGVLESIEGIRNHTIDNQEKLEMDNHLREEISERQEEIGISPVSLDPELPSDDDKPIVKIKEKITIPLTTTNNPQEIISTVLESPQKIDESTSFSLEEEEDEDDSVSEVAAMFGEDMDDEDDDGEDEGDDEDDDIESFSHKHSVISQKLQVLPLTKAVFPKVCYLVIDRYSELVTKPLREFADLGDIPSQETLQRTLPVFDNHRVAKRFCDAKGTLNAKKGKVIKVPDGKILQKTSSHLQAKGISRILMDGKIYSLIY